MQKIADSPIIKVQTSATKRMIRMQSNLDKLFQSSHNLTLRIIAQKIVFANNARVEDISASLITSSQILLKTLSIKRISSRSLW